MLKQQRTEHATGLTAALLVVSMTWRKSPKETTSLRPSLVFFTPCRAKFCYSGDQMSHSHLTLKTINLT